MSDGFWMSFFAFLTSLMTAVIGGFMAWKMAKLAAETAKNTIASADNAIASADNAIATSEIKEAVAVVKADIAEVHKATNSLTEQLVAKTEQEALARGGIEERARADERQAGSR